MSKLDNVNDESMIWHFENMHFDTLRVFRVWVKKTPTLN